MGEGIEFSVEGLQELENDLRAAVRRAPAQAEETLSEIAKDFKKSAKKRAENELMPHEREHGEEKKAIKKKWGSKVINEGIGATALIWNSARHYHLIEDGHNLVKDGRTIGFVEGKHIMEKTRDEYQDIVPQRFQQMVDDILREGDLD